MRFPLNWLRQWVSIDISPALLAEKLSLIGLEVDHIAPASGEFTDIVVGKIVSIAQHPDADKLRICQVITAEEGVEQQIVCGGANARAGLMVALAPIGARLPGDIKIKAAKLRGVASQGMLCSAVELGLADSSDGILELPDDAPLGTLLSDYLQLPDTLIDIDLTPNRGDCLSVLGVAREVSALMQQPLHEIDCTPPASTIADTIKVDVLSDAACPRYMGQVICNIDSTASSPMWLQEALRRCGLRAIHPVVDVTNYVMLALGQPLHAFDLDTIQGAIHIRHAHADETVTLLDEQSITLTVDDAVIADEKQVLALAGVMGGQSSAVNANTTHIFLESAHFEPTAIGLSARRHKLQTDSAYRFERGVDPTLPSRALALAVSLLQEIVGGEIGPVIDVTHKTTLPSNPWIDITHQQITQWLGFDITNDTIISILTHLGFELDKAQAYRVRAPSYRFDVTCAADVLEEIARLYGYDRIPSQLPQASLLAHPIPPTQIATRHFSQLLANRGYHEVITYSFVDPTLQSKLFPDSASLDLVNPIAAQLSCMRVSLWPGLLTTLQYNQRHQQARIRLFEHGICFRQSQSLQQQRLLAGVIMGQAYPERWCNPAQLSDFYHIKGDIAALLSLSKKSSDSIRYVPSSLSALHPGQAADVYCGDQYLGTMGALHPRLVKQLKLDAVPFLFEISLSILEEAQVTQFAELSKFPAIRRDIALLVDKSVSFAQISQKVLESAGDLLKNVELFDEYVGKGVPSGQRSLALALTLQHAERTLVDDEVNTVVSRIIDAIASAFNASLRK